MILFFFCSKFQWKGLWKSVIKSEAFLYFIYSGMVELSCRFETRYNDSWNSWVQWNLLENLSYKKSVRPVKRQVWFSYILTSILNIKSLSYYHHFHFHRCLTFVVSNQGIKTIKGGSPWHDIIGWFCYGLLLKLKGGVNTKLM